MTALAHMTLSGQPELITAGHESPRELGICLVHSWVKNEHRMVHFFPLWELEFAKNCANVKSNQ